MPFVVLTTKYNVFFCNLLDDISSTNISLILTTVNVYLTTFIVFYVMKGIAVKWTLMKTVVKLQIDCLVMLYNVPIICACNLLSVLR